MSHSLKARLGTIAAAGALIVLAGAGGATAGSLITSAQIKNQTITSADIAKGGVAGSEIRNGTVGVPDLSPAAKRYIAAQAGRNGADGAAGQPGSNGSNGSDGAAGSNGSDGATGPAGTSPQAAHTDWTANPGSKIVSKSTVTLTGPDATSVEIQDLNVPVQAGDVVAFDVSFADGAVCNAGAPRLFLEVAGAYPNSYDDQTGCGGDTAPAGDNDQAGTVHFTVPANGRVGQAGIVYDAGTPGTVTVSNLTIDGRAVDFR